MSQESVLVLTPRMEDGLRQLVTEACQHARVDVGFWDVSAPREGTGEPSLVLAALPAGERTIPSEVADAVDAGFPAAPLLLLCDEPLVRPTVSLQQGRVTLLGQPLTREKISGRIRTALVRGDDLSRGGETGIRVREYRGREWWAAVVARGGNGGAPYASALRKHGAAGAGVLLAREDEAVVPLSVLEDAVDVMLSALPADQGQASVRDKVGERAAGVWFMPSGPRWVFYAPQPDLFFWMVSPGRLPERWPVAARLPPGQPWRRLNAASGDLVLLVALAPGGRADAERQLTDAALWPAAAAGGPALLDHLEESFVRLDLSGSALVMELR